MQLNLSPADQAKVIDIIGWIVRAGVDGRSERGLTGGLAQRLLAAGVPVDRVSMGSDVLDPVIQSRNYIWKSESGTEPFRYERGVRRSENWLKSTLFWMIENNQLQLHLPLDSAHARDFPLLVTLRDEGYVDYYSSIQPYGEPARIGGARGLMASFTSKQQLSAGDIAIIDAVMPAFSLAFLSRLNARILSRALETYLGRTPAARILKGDITRGEAQTIDAVVWMSDLVEFTRITDDMPREDILEFLNAYAEIVTDAVEAHGGEVLKFIGDGVLAVFPLAEREDYAAHCALDAALQVESQAKDLRVTRKAAERATAGITIALHRGKVLFGNFGSQDRLDFTALGSTVNEASRLCSLAKTLDQSLILSDEFKEAMQEGGENLVSLGRYALRGVGHPRHLYTVDRALIPNQEVLPLR